MVHRSEKVGFKRLKLKMSLLCITKATTSKKREKGKTWNMANNGERRNKDHKGEKEKKGDKKHRGTKTTRQKKG